MQLALLGKKISPLFKLITSRKPAQKLAFSSFHYPSSVHLHTDAYTDSKFGSSEKSITVDEAEVAKFSAMSQEWWDPNGSFKLLHAMNLSRVEYVLSQIKSNRLLKREPWNGLRPLEGLRVLDVGCGGGILAESLARLGAKVTAVDASPQNIGIAELHKVQDPLLVDSPDRLQYLCMTSHDLLAKLGPNSFDLVCSFEVIEHVQHPQEFINCIKQLLTSNGAVFISTMARNFLSRLLTIGMAEHILGLTPVGTHHYNKYINPDELANMLKSSGLTPCSMTHIHFNPLNNTWFLGNSISTQKLSLPPVNYIAMATCDTLI